MYRNGTIQLGDVVEFIVTTPKDERARQRKLSVRISESAASGAINPQSPVGQALLGSKKGDTVTVTCTRDAGLRKLLPELEGTRDRYVVWGEGTTGEMCLGILITS